MGNTSSMVLPLGTTKYAYDPMNRLVTLTTPKNLLFNYSYDLGGRRTALTYPNKIKTTYTYDNANRLLGLLYQNTLTNKNIASFTYTYDNVGNRLTLKDNEGSHTYTYDNDYRLTSVIYPLGTKLEYGYDSVGNRLSLKKNGAVSDTYTYDSANRLFTSNNKLYSYDANGNLTSEKTVSTNVTRTYSYDFENRLKQVTQGAKQAAYLYDGLGRRTVATVNGQATRVYYDGFETLFEVHNQTDAITQSFVHGPRIDETLQSGNAVYLYDGLGSVNMLTNAQGNPIITYAYDVFGATRFKTGNSNNEFQFTGRELDSETGLYYYRNRYYNSSIGRFITKDPIGLGGGINPYSYVRNNPVNYTDPYGLVAAWITVTAVVVVIVQVTELLLWPSGATPPQAIRGGSTATDLMYEVEQINSQRRELDRLERYFQQLEANKKNKPC